MKLSQLPNGILQLKVFREQMGLPLDNKVMLEDFGLDLGEEIADQVISEKLDFAKANAAYFQILGLVRYVAVTGSVAAGMPKSEDDIDIFVVVRNHCSWIYRALILLKMYKQILHYDDSEKRNKFCINFIVEEHGLFFEDGDLFLLHELLHMKSIYNYEYRDYIKIKNPWLGAFGVISHIPSVASAKDPLSKRITLAFVNVWFMYAQVLYMIVKFHSPNLKRIWDNHKKGRIAFYPERFKQEKLDEYKRAVNSE